MVIQKPSGTELKRYSLKVIRDGAKSAYQKDDHCHICDTEEELQLHHFTSLSILWENWCRRNKVKIHYMEDVLAVRARFIEENHDQLYFDVVTLCKTHHQNLHELFGKAPALGTAKAQRKWVEVRRSKWLEKVSQIT